MNAIEIIKLEKQRVAAEKAAKQAVEEHLRLVSKQRFARIHEFVTQLSDLPSKGYRWHSSDKQMPYRQHLAGLTETFVQFWDGSGNTGLTIYADGEHILYRESPRIGTRCISEQDAIDLLTKRAAEYLILET
jgi:hypothetical protein